MHQYRTYSWPNWCIWRTRYTKQSISPPEDSNKSLQTTRVVLAILIILLALTIFFKTEIKDVSFTQLGKENLDETVQLNIPSLGRTLSLFLQIVWFNEGSGWAAEVPSNGGELGSAYNAMMSNGVSVVVKRMREMNLLTKEPFVTETRRLSAL